MSWLITVLLAGVTVAAGGQLSGAALSAQSSNPGNQFTAASSFERLRVASGTYTGNGNDNRNITGVGFQPNLVIVKRNGNSVAVARSSTMTGDATKPLAGGGTALSTNMLQALQADGFQIGTNASVNTNGQTYHWVAIKAALGTMSVGSYTGNGAAGRSISGIGYSPEAVIILAASNQSAVLRIAGMSTGFTFDSGTGVANSITSLDAAGFTVSNSATTNTSGTAYHYISFNDVSGIADTGSYTGNGAAGRSITGAGLAPGFALVRSSSTSTARAGIWRTAAVTGNGSLRFNSAANDTTAITALQADGFQVGTNVDANANANPYAYLALEDEAP
jgi:hypothetical protein